MKKATSILIIILAMTSHSFCQMRGLQYWFYNNTAPILNASANDAEEISVLSTQIMYKDWYRFSDEQVLEMYYRMYEIKNTSIINYSTSDYEKLPFQSTNDNEMWLRKVDFGAELVENTSELIAATWNFTFQLRFDSPIQRIDPQLFMAQTYEVQLPASTDLTYTSSPEIMTTYLYSIEGYDAYNYSALISKDSILIVAATRFKDSYQIPTIVKRIGAGALRGGTWIRSLTIPSSVVAIGDKAFDQSSILTFYLLSTEVPTLGESVFGEQVPKELTIYVPSKSLRAYRKTWKPLKKHIKAFPKTFDYNLAKDSFDINGLYKIEYGLQLTEDGRIINKSNRFIDKNINVRLNEKETMLWQHMENLEMDLEWMTDVLLDKYDYLISRDSAYEECLRIMKKWYDAGLICKTL